MTYALDLFAGTGWGVACQRLGIHEYGVEIMPEAIQTRQANGMTTLYTDVWDGLLGNIPTPHHDILIASPPCQTFSVAGHGAGRKALDEVIEAIEQHAYKDPELLKEFGEQHDDRTALVLTPLAHVYRDRPEHVVLEQVPSVLPVWDAYAGVMWELGYSVSTRLLHAEQYGVPQTRKRAILIASQTRPADMPKPTHSKYYSRDPYRMDDGVLPWVSMADALKRFDYDTRYTQNNKLANQSVRPLSHPAPTVTAGHDSGNRGFIQENGVFTIATPAEVAALQSYPTMLRSNYGTGGDASNRGERLISEPAPTLTSKADRMKWDGERNMTAGEASALQTYEQGFAWAGAKTKQMLQIGNAVPPLLAQRVLETLI